MLIAKKKSNVGPPIQHMTLCGLMFLRFLQICVAIYLSTTPYPEIIRYDQEKTFFTSKNKKQTGEFPFGKFKSQDSVKLSVIVPAYNEEQRCKTRLPYPSRIVIGLDHDNIDQQVRCL